MMISLELEHFFLLNEKCLSGLNQHLSFIYFMNQYLIPKLISKVTERSIYDTRDKRSLGMNGLKRFYHVTYIFLLSNKGWIKWGEGGDFVLVMFDPSR